MKPDLRVGEELLGAWRANHSSGRQSIGGTLYLTSQRVLFVPNLVERLFRVESRAWELETLERVSVAPRQFKLTSAEGSERRRLALSFGTGIEHFVVNKVDAVAASFAAALEGPPP